MKLKKVGIDIVHGCQLRCLGCPNSTRTQKIELCPVENYERMLKNIDAEEIGALRLYNFGEPLIHKGLHKIVALIPQQKWKTKQVEITTNGQYINYSVLLKTLRQKVVTHIYISCDGNGTPDDYERLRPPAKWDILLENMILIKEIRDLASPKTCLGTRTIAETDSDKKAWKRILKPLGYTPLFRKWSTRTDTRCELWKQRSVPGGPCKFVRNNDSLYADADGTVVPCCIHPKAIDYGSLLHNKASKILKMGKWANGVMKTSGRSFFDVCGKCTKS